MNCPCNFPTVPQAQKSGFLPTPLALNKCGVIVKYIIPSSVISQQDVQIKIVHLDI